MSAQFTFKVSPAKIDQDAFRVEFLAAARASGKELVKEFSKTTKTWKGEKPTFEPTIELNNETGVGVDIALTDGGSGMGVKKWFWLDRGTAVRHALMSQDWQSKTTPGFLGSGAGRGRVVKVSTDIEQPGIEARGWAKMIAKDYKPKFKAAMKAALAAGAKRATKGG